MIERTTVRLPKELLQRARIKAAEEGRSLTSLIEDGLRVVVSEQRELPEGKRVMPRVSTARGRLLPGIDLDDGSAVQQMYDLEYAERMKRFR